MKSDDFEAVVDDEERANPVCSLEFSYHGEDIMLALKREKKSVMDPLALYAMACAEIIEKYNDEIVELMEELVLPSGHSYRVH